MRYELKKVENNIFKEYYEGHNPQTGKEVHCILDDNCVRYVEIARSSRWGCKKTLGRHEYKNQNKARCMAAATAALNR